MTDTQDSKQHVTAVVIVVIDNQFDGACCVTEWFYRERVCRLSSKRDFNICGSVHHAL